MLECLLLCLLLLGFLLGTNSKAITESQSMFYSMLGCLFLLFTVVGVRAQNQLRGTHRNKSIFYLMVDAYPFQCLIALLFSSCTGPTARQSGNHPRSGACSQEGAAAAKLQGHRRALSQTAHLPENHRDGALRRREIPQGEWLALQHHFIAIWAWVPAFVVLYWAWPSN